MVRQIPSRRGKELLSLLPTAIKAIAKGKIGIRQALFGHKLASQDLRAVRTIYDKVESRPERLELNLYVSGSDEDQDPPATAQAGGEAAGAVAAQVAAGSGAEPEGKPSSDGEMP